MTNFLIKKFVRMLFVFTSRKRAIIQAEGILKKYEILAEGLTPKDGQIKIEVPPIRGVDEDMRRWSFYMILEHNSIVNRSISAIIRHLIHGGPLSGAATIDPKKDVMPSESAGAEQLHSFRKSVNTHVRMAKDLRGLRGKNTMPHMIFGDFDAHKWNCMFPFHLGLHYKQAEHVVRLVKAK